MLVELVGYETCHEYDFLLLFLVFDSFYSISKQQVGGALVLSWHNSGSLVDNCKFYYNFAYGTGGGAIYLQTQQTTISNSFFAFNNASASTSLWLMFFHLPLEQPLAMAVQSTTRWLM